MQDTLHEAATAADGDAKLDLGALARGLLGDCLNAMMEEQASELAAATGTQRNGHREHISRSCGERPKPHFVTR